MRIAGLQKMSLLDYPGKIACTVFLPGCNFRCPFCHNFELVDTNITEMDHIALLEFLSKRRGILEGVCVSGGEPTLQPELPELLRSIRELGFSVKLDTNGSRPQVLRQIVDSGLADYVAMDVKNGPGAYPAACGAERMELAPVEESLRLLLEGRVDYEFRTTAVLPLHTEASVSDMARWVRELSENRAKRWFLQPFTDRETVPFAGFSAPEKETLLRWKDILSSAADWVAVRGMD